MPTITLTSDYGTKDYRVAAIKGKILELKEDLQIVDISNDIEAYNLTQTSYVVRNAYKYFPKGTVHIIAVDSFFSRFRKSILMKADDHYFIAADNGILSLIFNDIKPEAVYEITFNSRFDDIINFTVTDIFVPAAVHLQNGGLPEVIGRKLKSYKQMKLPQPTMNDSEKMMVGEIIYIDNFGNIVTNITKELFEKYAASHENFQIKIRNIYINKIVRNYTDIVSDWSREPDFHGKEVALFNRARFLEIAIYKGSKNNGAHSLFGMNFGEKIYIEFS